jgi:hypothetical protein
MSDLGRLLIVIGILLIAVGGLVLLASRLGLPFGLGRLPGDVVIRRENMTVYLPIASSILVSVVVSLLLYLFRR